MSSGSAADELFSPLQLRSGQVLRNRIAKAAMEEGMAGRAQLPDKRLISLYRRWGAGGAGLLITGNVMVHAEALTGPGGIVLDAEAPLEPFAANSDGILKYTEPQTVAHQRIQGFTPPTGVSHRAWAALLTGMLKILKVVGAR
ncbi:NADH:flavin oxidoreductase / NADH oxidase family [Nocardia amikacinitolerans]|nr:NADH:flavin oxidoreductase / NADH oxidase family [Nocardia amikacinitolerans]